MTPNLKAGDETPDVIYHAVGLALTKWELMEGELANTFARLINAEGEGAHRAYGTIPAFASRKGMLLEAYSCLPKWRTHEFEALPGILKDAGTLAAARNEIAHGVVLRKIVNNVIRGHFLVPAPYNSRKKPSRKEEMAAFIESVNAGTFPATIGAPIKASDYELTAADIHERADAFVDLFCRLNWMTHGGAPNVSHDHPKE